MTLLLDADVPQCPLFPRRNVTIDPIPPTVDLCRNRHIANIVRSADSE